MTDGSILQDPCVLFLVKKFFKVMQRGPPSKEAGQFGYPAVAKKNASVVGSLGVEFVPYQPRKTPHGLKRYEEASRTKANYQRPPRDLRAHSLSIAAKSEARMCKELPVPKLAKNRMMDRDAKGSHTKGGLRRFCLTSSLARVASDCIAKSSGSR